ncbi:MAG TPA: T9SS type A sorting domain-containing protein, partial [Patescibacteria group bacterium]|nr:T9SS type A sorting domain-containing protein [Patescibacteria group bacterium]
VVLGMLRHELGDSLYFGALQNYLQKYAYGNATTDSLLKTMNDYTGRNLTPFFHQWVYGKGWPQIALEVAPSSNGTEQLNLKIIQRQSNEWGIFKNLPVEIGFQLPSGQMLYRIFTINEREETFTVDSVASFVKITVNQGPTVRSLLEYFSLTNVPEIPFSNGSRELNITPNPASEDVVIRFKNENDKAFLKIFDVLGAEIHSEELPPLHNDILLKTGSFAVGSYVISITTNGTNYLGKLNINR